MTWLPERYVVVTGNSPRYVARSVRPVAGRPCSPCHRRTAAAVRPSYRPVIRTSTARWIALTRQPVDPTLASTSPSAPAAATVAPDVSTDGDVEPGTAAEAGLTTAAGSKRAAARAPTATDRDVRVASMRRASA